MQQALESALAELVLGAELDVADDAAVRAWFDRHGVAPEDRAALDVRRLGVYRGLVRHNLRQAVELAMPRVVARLGPTFDEYFDRFLAERGPRTHYLRDVTAELLDFCEPSWENDRRIFAWTMELARHEALQIELGAMPVPSRAEEPRALELDQGARFTDACRLVRYQHAVHRLSEDTADRTEPTRAATALFVYRSPEHEVRHLELTPLAAAILERLLAGSSLRQAVTGTASELGVALDAGVLKGAAQLLADLGERGALLGSRELSG